MNSKYQGRDSIMLSQSTADNRFYAGYVHEGQATPTIPQLADVKLSLVRVFTGIGEPAYEVFAEAVRRANRGEKVDFERILD